MPPRFICSPCRETGAECRHCSCKGTARCNHAAGKCGKLRKFRVRTGRWDPWCTDCKAAYHAVREESKVASVASASTCVPIVAAPAAAPAPAAPAACALAGFHGVSADELEVVPKLLAAVKADPLLSKEFEREKDDLFSENILLKLYRKTKSRNTAKNLDVLRMAVRTRQEHDAVGVRDRIIAEDQCLADWCQLGRKRRRDAESSSSEQFCLLGTPLALCHELNAVVYVLREQDFSTANSLPPEEMVRCAVYRHMWCNLAVRALSLAYRSVWHSVVIYDCAGMSKINCVRFLATRGRRLLSFIAKSYPSPDVQFTFVNSSPLLHSVITYWRSWFNKMGASRVLSFASLGHLHESAVGSKLLASNALPVELGGSLHVTPLLHVRISKFVESTKPGTDLGALGDALAARAAAAEGGAAVEEAERDAARRAAPDGCPQSAKRIKRIATVPRPQRSDLPQLPEPLAVSLDDVAAKPLDGREELLGEGDDMDNMDHNMLSELLFPGDELEGPLGKVT